MWLILLAYVNAAHARLSSENMVWVGADEINLRTGHNYLMVFANLIDKKVIFATPGKGATVCATFFQELLLHNAHLKATQHLAIDIKAADTKGVSDHFRNARVVCDKFHVIQNVVKACD